MNYFQLLISFLKVGLFSIGGGYASIPIIQNEVVTIHNWISLTEYTNLITIAEMTPGPIAVNVSTFVGVRLGGVGCGIFCTFACILPSIVFLSVLFFIYKKYSKLPLLQSILSALRITVIALVANAAISIIQTVLINSGTQSIDIVRILLFIGAFVLIRKYKTDSILTMIGCGVVNMVISMIK